MSRLVALIVLTAAFAPAAVMGALPLVTPIVALLLTCWFLLDQRSNRFVTDPAVEAPLTAAP